MPGRAPDRRLHRMMIVDGNITAGLHAEIKEAVAGNSSSIWSRKGRRSRPRTAPRPQFECSGGYRFQWSADVGQLCVRPCLPPSKRYCTARAWASSPSSSASRTTSGPRRTGPAPMPISRWCVSRSRTRPGARKTEPSRRLAARGWARPYNRQTARSKDGPEISRRCAGYP